MKKGFFYYCVTASLVLHLLLVLFVRLEHPRNKKEKEPIAVDLLGPLRSGDETRLPKPSNEARPGVVTPNRSENDESRLARAVRPAFPDIPVPSPAPPAQASIQPPSPPAPAARQEQTAPGELKQAASPPARAVQPPAANPQAGEKFVRPTLEDLKRYAKLDRDFERPLRKDEITLDTDDLMYTSYLQGLKRRIELIWKYPETARRDGLQGDLVMKFSIAKSGRVEDIELVKSSGYPILDDAAKQALKDASPFNPLPEQWNKDYFTITGTFMYRLYGLYVR